MDGLVIKYAASHADYIIAVDPDTEKNGLAVLNKEKKRVSVFALPFAECYWRIVNIANAAKERNENVLVLVEGGWLNQSNWHFHPQYSKTKCAEIARRVGMNHECGIAMMDMLGYQNLNVYAVKPLIKHWEGYDGKITQNEITQFIDGLPKRMNQEERDAALIAWVFAGFPIRIKKTRI